MLGGAMKQENLEVGTSYLCKRKVTEIVKNVLVKSIHALEKERNR